MAVARYEAEWQGYRLVIEERPDHFQLFVYDPTECKVLYTASRIDIEKARFAAVPYAATVRFGPKNDLRPEIIAAMLVWEPV